VEIQGFDIPCLSISDNAASPIIDIWLAETGSSA